jgi:uncharacterized protein YcbK (DUF882 family)
MSHRAIRLARVFVWAAALAWTVTAAAEPPGRLGRTPTPAPAPTIVPGSLAAVAYMTAKQALVGWHAPSDKAVPRDAGGRAMLALTTINRGESLTIPASTDDGGFASLDIDRVTHVLRAMSGDEHPIDPRTLAVIYRIQTHFGVPEIRVVSGYRVPKPGSRSNHGRGRALDLVVPGVADQDVAGFARDLWFVGVGVYPTSQFVHVDIRPRSYFWIDYSGPHKKNRERGILGGLAAKSDASATERGQAPIEPFFVSLDVDAALRVRGVAPPAGSPDDDEDEES